MSEEQLKGLIVGAISFVLVVILFLFIGNDPNTTAKAEVVNNNDSSGLLMAVTFTLTLLALIAFNHFRGQKTPPNENDLDLTIKEDDTSDLRYQLAQTRRDLQNSQRELSHATGTIKQLQDAILNLFGTTDFTQITSAVSTLYHELSELRDQQEQGSHQASLDKQLTRQQELTARLAGERNQATALLAAIRDELALDQTTSLIKVIKELVSQNNNNWQEKAEQLMKELISLRHQHKEASQWKEVELTIFMDTVNYGEDKLTTNRWGRRLEQRFNKEQLKLVGHSNLTKLPLTEPEPK